MTLVCALTLVVGHDFNTPILEDTDARVRGSEIDTDDSSHRGLLIGVGLGPNGAQDGNCRNPKKATSDKHFVVIMSHFLPHLRISCPRLGTLGDDGDPSRVKIVLRRGVFGHTAILCSRLGTREDLVGSYADEERSLCKRPWDLFPPPPRRLDRDITRTCGHCELLEEHCLSFYCSQKRELEYNTQLRRLVEIMRNERAVVVVRWRGWSVVGAGRRHRGNPNSTAIPRGGNITQQLDASGETASDQS